MKTRLLKNLVLFIILFTLFSCENNSTVENLNYDSAKLSEVIADLEYAEQLLTTEKGNRKDSVRKHHLDAIAKIHDVNIDSILSDIDKIEKEPKRYEMVLDSAIKVLSKSLK